MNITDLAAPPAVRKATLSSGVPTGKVSKMVKSKTSRQLVG